MMINFVIELERGERRVKIEEEVEINAEALFEDLFEKAKGIVLNTVDDKLAFNFNYRKVSVQFPKEPIEL